MLRLKSDGKDTSLFGPQQGIEQVGSSMSTGTHAAYCKMVITANGIPIEGTVQTPVPPCRGGPCQGLIMTNKISQVCCLSCKPAAAARPWELLLRRFFRNCIMKHFTLSVGETKLKHRQDPHCRCRHAQKNCSSDARTAPTAFITIQLRGCRVDVVHRYRRL